MSDIEPDIRHRHEIIADLVEQRKKNYDLQSALSAAESELLVLKKERDDLLNALMEYGHHKPTCSIDPCNCGILAAMGTQKEE